MKVNELIKILETMPQDADVEAIAAWSGGNYGGDVCDVELNNEGIVEIVG